MALTFKISEISNKLLLARKTKYGISNDQKEFMDLI
jgi:hypothetical protein